ncbi:MAG: carboxypeptidase regulatory-like domain-containing protein [Polyangiaceae bacterium]
MSCEGRGGRLRTWLARGVAAAFLLAGVAGHGGVAGAAPVRIQVRGSAQIRVQAWSDDQGITVRGELLDDAGGPIPIAPLVVKAFAERGTQLSAATWLPCDARFRPGGRGLEGVITDERGAFCVRTSAAGAATVTVRFDGSDSYDGGEVRAEVDSARGPLAAVVLRFEPTVDVIDLDRETVPISGSLRIGRSDTLVDAPRREGLPVVLEDERGTTLAETKTGGDGRARFEIPTKSLGAPGAGEMRLRFAGTDALAKALSVQPIVRQAEAKLAVAVAPEGSSDEEIPIDVDVTSSRGAIDGGVVEALRDGSSIGAGSVKAGKARVTITIATERAGAVPITLRYVPSAPWYRPGEDLTTQVQIAGAGVWRQILLALLVAGVAAWVVAGWRRAKPKARREDDGGAPPPSGRPGVQVIGRAPSAGGWRGVVVDAHEGTPVAGARLSIVMPAFQGDGVVARAVADERGAFSFEPTQVRDGRLLVEADLHSRYEQALPPPSALHVALITRRRALLDRLVRWARNQGSPFDGHAEPTPGHVRRAAARLQMQDRDKWTGVESWAAEVENAAFGPEPPGAAEEEAVKASEPSAFVPGPRRA